MASGYIAPFIERRGLFNGVGVSERPDTVCGKISEGRIAIIVDGTPNVLIVPHLFIENFQACSMIMQLVLFLQLLRVG